MMVTSTDRLTARMRREPVDRIPNLTPVMQKDMALCGSVDPVAVILDGSPDTIKAAMIACRDVGGPNWLAAPGCEISRSTPPGNLLALRDALFVK